MEFRKVLVPSPEDPSKMVEGHDIPVAESTERWSEITLQDGTVFRAKINVSSAIKLTGRLDAQGNPVYMINAAPVVAMVPRGDNQPKGD